MAAAITTTATTLEGQALEIALAIQAAEATQSTDEIPLNNITITPDTEASTVAVALTLPTTLSGAAGAITYTADEYLS